MAKKKNSIDFKKNAKFFGLAEDIIVKLSGYENKDKNKFRYMLNNSIFLKADNDFYYILALGTTAQGREKLINIRHLLEGALITIFGKDSQLRILSSENYDLVNNYSPLTVIRI